MPKRAWIYVLAAIAAFAVLIIGVYAGVLNTGAGRRAVLNALEPTLEEALGGDVDIGGTGGHWPNYIILRDVTVADREGVWLRLDELALRWNPLALLSGRLSADDLSVPRGTLIRLPENTEEENQAPDLPKLPKLPNLTINSLTIGALDVKAAAAGHDTVLHATGSANMHPELLRLSLALNMDRDNMDRADIAVDWAPSEDHLAANVQVTGPEGGLIARLLGVDGNVSVSAGGTGPASDWSGTVEARAGTLGGLSGKLACECGVPPKLKLDLTADPGPALSAEARRYLGDTPRIGVALYSEQPSALTLEITALEVPAGKLIHPLRVSLNEAGRMLRFDVSAVIAPGPVLKGELPPGLSGEIELLARGGIPHGGGVRVAEAVVSSQTARLNIERMVLTPDGSLDGIGRLDIKSTRGLPESIAQVAGTGATLDFGLAGMWGETLRLDDVVLNTASGSRASGSLAYDLNRAALNANLDLTLPGPVFAALTGLPESAEPVTGEVIAEGTRANLSGTLNARTPELKLEGRTLPPARAALTLRGGLDDPRGKLTIRRLDKGQKPVMLSADLSWPERKTLHVTALSAQLDGAALEGEAHIGTDTGRITGKAKLDVPDLAVLSEQASGRLNAQISLKREAKGFLFSATATSPDLSYGTTRAKNARVSASGPLADLAIEGGAELIDSPETGPVRDFKLAASAAVTEPVTVTVNKLSAIADGTAVALNAPARLQVGERTFALSEAKFSWGERGSLTAQAMLSPNALKASLEMSKATIPGEPALITGFVRVDTEKQDQPGALNLRLDPQDGPRAALEITGTWNGQRLDLTGNLTGSGKQAGNVAGEILSASLPLTIMRKDGLSSMSTEGPINARLRYQGKLDPLLAIFVEERERNLDGILNADMRVGGTLKAPEVNGSVALMQGQYEDATIGTTLNAVNARLDFTGTTGAASGTLKLTAFDARKSKGKRPPVTGDGRFTLDPEGLRVNAKIRLQEATLLRRRDLTTTLSGTTNLSGVLPELTLAGDVRIDRLDLLIKENGPEGIKDVPVVLVNEKGEPLDHKEKKVEAAADEGREGVEVVLDLKVRSDGQAFVRGRGLDSEWKADLSVSGTIGQPELNGALTLKKGTFSFAGRPFTLSNGEVSFTGQLPPNPVLNIVAEYETEQDTKALVRVSGRTSEPEVKLESQPPLPREQVMALVLFGKPVKELTALQALQVTRSLAQLTGAGPFGGGSILDRARRTLGLDLLDLTFGKEDGDVGLKVGRYVSEGIFVSASQDVTGESGKVSVQVELTDEFSIETDVGQDASGGVSAQWKKDY